jgi:hypothetical protein
MCRLREMAAFDDHLLISSGLTASFEASFRSNYLRVMVGATGVEPVTPTMSA